MKLIHFSVLALALSASFMAGAAEKPKDDPACANIVKSCETAGFMPGEHKKDGKGLWMDCVAKVAKGETVAGVTATKEEATACAAVAKGMHKHK